MSTQMRQFVGKSLNFGDFTGVLETPFLFQGQLLGVTPTAWEGCLEPHTALTVVTHARLASKRYLSSQNVPEALRSWAEAQESCRPSTAQSLQP